MKRVIYFGTKGSAGHFAFPIIGSFSRQEIEEVESIDCDSFYKVFAKYEFKLSKFKGYTIFGFPASPDDSRGGSKTVVMIEGDASIQDFLGLIDGNSFLKGQFDRLTIKYNVNWNIL